MLKFSAWQLRSFASTRATCLHKNIHVSSTLWAADTKSTPKKDEAPSDPKDAPLQPLKRPLGVRQRPTTVDRPAMEKIKDYLQTENLEAQRRHL